MKKIIFISILVFQFSFMYSQNQNISKIWGQPLNDDRVSDVFEVNNNVFFVAVHRDYNGTNINHESIVLKLDSNCTITDSLKLMNRHHKGKYYFSSEFFYLNNRIIGMGYTLDSFSLKVQLWLAEFDENLIILRDTMLGDETELSGLFTVYPLITSQNKIMLTATIYPPLQNGNNHLVWMIDSCFNILQENSFAFNYAFNGISVVEMASSQSFHVATTFGIIQIKQSDLSVDSMVWQPYQVFIGNGGCKRVNDSVYIHPTKHIFLNNHYGSIYNTCLFVRDMNGKTLDSIVIWDMQKSFDKTSYANIDFFTTDSIFVTGSNYSLDSAYLSNEDNAVFLWNISINGTINWQQYYGIGKKFLVSDITKTSDGGCFLVGRVLDWHLFPDISSDVFFLKVDKNGNVTGSSGVNEKITQSEILVYPNPAKETLTFNTGMYSNYQLSIFNALGQTVLQQHCTSSQNTFSIQDFQQGMYYYKLVSNKGKIISGKFVKE